MAMQHVRARRDSQCGVTLIEQIMVVVIVSVLTAVAMPSLVRLLRRNQVQVAQMDFFSALQHARGMAVTTGKSVLFCPSHDGMRCSGETRWESGWLIAHDRDRDGQPDATPLRTKIGYTGITILGDSSRRLVRFRSDGSASGTTNTLRFCSRGQPDQTLLVVISNVGRIRGATASAAEAASCASVR